MGIKLSNNAFATLAAGINSSATSITVTSGQGARFPTLSAGDYFYATLIDTSNNLEIVKCTARSTDVLTVVRAQESTTARAYVTGDRIEIRITAATFVDATTVTPTAVSDQNNTSTGYFDLPSGTTAERPASPANGMVRYNTTLAQFEVYQNGAWIQYVVAYNVEYLVVAGGGGGGTQHGGGGGAGGYRSSVVGESSGGGAAAESLLPLLSGVSYTITIGGGGAISPSGGNGDRPQGGNGTDSTFASITSIGGGGGTPYRSAVNINGSAGGSGGGGAAADTGTTSTGGAGTSGQGFAGGSGRPGTGGTYNAGGGGGAGAVGVAGTGSGAGGAGGAGVSSSINGTATFRAGGGGGGSPNGTAGGAGGNGGGGAGGLAANGTAGTPNTGGGGGGGGAFSVNSGLGGSGVVILRYSGSQRGTGGTVTSSGGYTIHTFNTSSTYTA